MINKYIHYFTFDGSWIIALLKYICKRNKLYFIEKFLRNSILY